MRQCDKVELSITSFADPPRALPYKQEQAARTHGAEPRECDALLKPPHQLKHSPQDARDHEEWW